MLKSNKRLGSARNLTSDLELRKSKEVYEENSEGNEETRGRYQESKL
jgi:hypothetical protein